MPHTANLPSSAEIRAFRQTVWRHFQANRRSFPWRDTTDPYGILVSEVMLQQTQTSRVIPFYNAFLSRFPTVTDLARGSRAEVLRLWSGLGYNRRAIALHECAQQIVTDHAAVVPLDYGTLQTLPGIGPYTAAAVICFAGGAPTAMIETNIRTVFLNHFFPRRRQVKDQEILPLVAATIDRRRAREWFYALMDYGVALKAAGKGLTKKSSSVRKQSRFEGSVRQVRGAILRLLLSTPTVSSAQIAKLPFDRDRINKAVGALAREGTIRVAGRSISLAS